MMTRKEALEILEQYQEWRLGKCDSIDYKPKQITEALNFAIRNLNSKIELKSGDRVKIKCSIKGHMYPVGEEITILEYDTEEDTGMWNAENEFGEQWWVSENEVEII